ncbi:hypothetical protein CP533_6181 [Ophiocordyceps camponoti-saundersi (nom. inval.)]|nr:hypothetical protein CP533_6181 [Ophiocordyceps camponoti-saundersi (nom. inval.)]
MSARDEDQVRRAMLDDLGRSRLDILPLSNKEFNGSSFAPRRDGSERKFAPEFRVQLKSKWNNVSFEDEEARQMEGLANDDARPWARKAADIPVKPVPSRPAKTMAQPTKKQAPPAKTQAQPIKKTSPAKTQPVKAQPVKAQPAKTQTSKLQPSKTPSTKSSTTKTLPSEVQPPKVRQSRTRPRSKRRKRAKRMQFRPELTQSTDPNEDVLCGGSCYFSNSADKAEVLVAYALLIDTSEDSAFLALTLPGGERKKHNVIDIETTIQQEHTCVVTPRAGKGTFSYSLRLDECGRNAPQLKRYLDALRKHADVQPSQQKADVQPAQPVIDLKPLPQQEIQSSALMDLIDLEIVPPVASEQPTEECGSVSTVTDAADQLTEFLHRILRELVGCGHGSCEDMGQELEQRAKVYWVNMGFAESEVDDLLASLRAMTRVQKKVKLRQTEDSRAREATCEAPNTIRYSAAELESLVGNAVPCPGIRDIVGSDTRRPLPAMPADASREKARLPSMSKCRDWLLRSPSVSTTASDVKEAVIWPAQADQMATGEDKFGSSTKDVTDEADTMPAPTLSVAIVQTPTSRPAVQVNEPGLGTSRWASK